MIFISAYTCSKLDAVYGHTFCQVNVHSQGMLNSVIRCYIPEYRIIFGKYDTRFNLEFVSANVIFDNFKTYFLLYGKDRKLY